MKTCCIVVIGHVDHGKTTLVRALTGIETDRLPEEKSRGLSITPGFAHHSYPTGIVDFIDAPGHEDFIQAMVSGATGARFVLVVISASEGIGAQTLEHLRIAALLGITNGVIAVTKSDLLSQSEQAERLIEIQRELAQTPFGDIPLIFCSAVTGDGLDALHDALRTLLFESENTPPSLHSILPIDRVFSQSGSGTIVTGTLLGQKISLDDAVVLHPTGRNITLRGLQSRGKTRDTIQGGERMAANLRGVATTDVKRGAVLCVRNTVAPSHCIDAAIELLPTSIQPLKHMEEVRVMFGTSSEVASVRLFGGRRIGQRQSGFAQLRFRSPVVGFAGQRAILRRLSPTQTIGGVVFLDPLATPVKSSDTTRLHVLKAAQTRDVAQIASSMTQSNGGIAILSDIARLAQVPLQSVSAILGDDFTHLNNDTISTKVGIKACKAEVLRALSTFHTDYPRRALAPHKIIETSSVSPILLHYVEKALLADGDIRAQDTKIAASTHDPLSLLSQIEKDRLQQIEATFSTADLKPPQDTAQKSALDTDLLNLLIDTGRLIVLQNISLKQSLIFHSDALNEAVLHLMAAFSNAQTFTTGEARTILNTSRKVIVPVLEHFDKIGVTIRTENLRQMTLTN